MKVICFLLRAALVQAVVFKEAPPSGEELRAGDPGSDPGRGDRLAQIASQKKSLEQLRAKIATDKANAAQDLAKMEAELKAKKERQAKEFEEMTAAAEQKEQKRLEKERLEQERRIAEAKNLQQRAEARAQAQQNQVKIKVTLLQRRLLEQAIAARKEAETNAVVLGQDDPLNVMKGASSKEALTLTQGLSEAVKDSAFMDRATGMRDAMQEKIAESVLDIQETIANFVEASATMNESELVKSTGTLVLDLRKKVQNHQRDGSDMKDRFLKAAPENLRMGVNPMVKRARPFTQPLILVASNFMKMSSAADACGNLTAIGGDLVTFISNITEVRSTVNATAASLPMLGSLIQDGTKAEDIRLMEGAINLAYMEIAGAEEVAKAVMGTLAPAVLSRLRCTVNTTNDLSAGHRVDFGVAAVALAGVVTLLGI